MGAVETIPAAGSKHADPQIILIDDEELILDEYFELLESEGLPCEVESDPQRAYARILSNPQLRLVITDCRMSGMSGLELIRRLQAELPLERRLTYILLSGYEEEGANEFAGITHLLKPVDVDLLLTTVRNGLAG